MTDDDFPQGPYDPDFHGYPYEHDSSCRLMKEGGPGNKCDCSYSKGAVNDDNSDQ